MLNLYSVLVVTDCGNSEETVVERSKGAARDEAIERVIMHAVDYGCAVPKIYGTITVCVNEDL